MPDTATDAATDAAPAPVFAQAVEAILSEAERHAAWLSELENEVTAARARRDQLAASLDGLFRALGPQAARPYAARLSAITGPAPERPVGNLSPDGRLAALKSILSDWPHETITPQAATEALRERGFDVPGNYAVNRFRGMMARGVLLRVGAGRYRIVRTHPEMVGTDALRARSTRPQPGEVGWRVLGTHPQVVHARNRVRAPTSSVSGVPITRRLAPHSSRA